MPQLPEPSLTMRVEEHNLWRSAPALIQQTRRAHMDACGGRHARRVLFGRPDREETRRFVKEELAAIRSAEQEKYNFDFENMVPLAGAYEWEPVAPGDVSAAYQFGRLQSGLHRSARRLQFDAPEPRPVEPARPPAGPAPPEAGSPADGGAAPAGPRAPLAPPRQTTITDFWRSRKRPSAFTPCGDRGTKRSSPASPATTAPTAKTTKTPSPVREASA